MLLLALFLSGCCCRQHAEESCMPLTNNPELIRYDEEWKPAANDPWWQVSIYETLKDLAEE